MQRVFDRHFPFTCWMTFFSLWLLDGTLAAQSEPTAAYAVRFDSTWSRETHPYEFPLTPHFSGLIGGTHNDTVTFWRPGELASPGIENMAENGSKTPLNLEVAARVAEGSAGEVLSGGGIGLSPGTAVASFTATREYPLVTLVSMIAPSPDWFVGVSALNLLESGDWAERVVIDLHAYDAGTDDGIIYTSPDAEAAPHVPIARIRSQPFPDDTPLGTFTFTRIRPRAERSFVRGDANANAVADISDAVFVLSALFQGGELPSCQKSADTNDDGALDISDAVYLLAYLFQGGTEPRRPFPACGTDPTTDGLSCEGHVPREG